MRVLYPLQRGYIVSKNRFFATEPTETSTASAPKATRIVAFLSETILSESDTEEQTCNRLVRPGFMYQTDTRNILVLAFGLLDGIGSSLPRGPLSRVLGWDGRIGKPGTGQTRS